MTGVSASTSGWPAGGSTPTPPSGRVARIGASMLALALPMLVFGAGGWALGRPDGATGKALAMDRELLEAGPPDVVVLGSSLARTNVDLDVLASELGVPRRRIVLLTLPNATAAHWYAVLENRVFAKGYRPRVVIMVGALTTMVTPDVLMDTNGERLVNLLSDDEPVIAAKVFKSRGPYEFALLSLRERAGQLRDLLVTGWRDLALAGLFLGRSERQAGARLAQRANETVFADDAMAYELHDAQPTGLYVGEVEQIDLSGLDIARDSLIPDIAALATAHDAHAVFVRTPFPPSNADNDRIPSEVEQITSDVMADSGAFYVDLRGLNLSDTYFRDMRHMSVEGAALFTRALARTVMDADLMGGGGGWSGHAVRPSVVTRALRSTGGWALTSDGGCLWSAPAGALVGLTDAALEALGAAGALPVRVEAGGLPLAWRAGAGRDGTCEPGFGVSGGRLWVVADVGTTGAPGARPGSKAQDDVAAPGARSGGQGVDGGRGAGWGGQGVDGGRGLAGQDAAPLDAPTVSWVADGPVPRAGDAAPIWWVYPGSSLELRFDEPWGHPPGAFEARVLGDLVGQGSASSVRVTVFDQRVPLAEDDGRVWAELKPASAPVDRPWSVRVEVAAGGPSLLLRNLAIGASPYTTHVIGLPESLFGASARLVGGRQEDTQVVPTFSSPPPALPAPGLPRPAPRGTAVWSLPTLSALADGPDQKAPHVDSCSPLRVFEDGVMLDHAHFTCQDMATLKDGRSCHAGDALFFSASDASDPTTNGRTYTLGLDPDRVCERRTQVQNTTPMRDSLWIYPGDRVEVVLPPEQLRAFLRGADLLELAADPLLAPAGARLHVELRAGGVLVHQEDIEAQAGGEREFRRRVLSPALTPRLEDVRVVLTNRDPRAYWLWVMGALSETSPFSESSAARLVTDGVRPIEAPTFSPGEADQVAVGPSLFDDPRPADGVRRPDSVTRTGAVPEVQAGAASVRDGVAELRLPSLWVVSNQALAQRGLGWVSPVRVRVGDRDLRPAGSRRALRDPACLDACFAHLGESVTFPTTQQGVVQGVSVSMSPDVPMAAPHGERVYWAYPGTTTTLTWSVPWTDPGAYVDVHLTELRGDRTAGQGRPRLRMGDDTRIFQPGEAWSAARVYLGAPAPGPIVIEVIVPQDSALSMLRDLVLVDGDRRWTLLPDPAAQAVRVEN